MFTSKFGNVVTRLLFFVILAGAGLFFFTSPAQAAVDATIIGACRTLHTGPDLDFNTLATVCAGEDGSVIARNRAGTWAFFRTGSVNGWIPSWAVDVHGASFSALPVWNRPMRGAIYRPAGVVTGSDSVVDDNAIPLFAGADSRYNVADSVPAGTAVTVLAQDPSGNWRFVRATGSRARGWVPREWVSTSANPAFLPVWVNPMRGAVLSQ